MEIKGKRILITCREDDSRPFYFLIKDWMKYNEVAAYFIKASESGFKKNPSNESTYYAFKKNISLKVYDVNSIAEIFINIRNDDNVIDQFFLEKIEKEYTHFKNITLRLFHHKVLIGIIIIAIFVILYLSTTIKLVDIML